MQSRLRWVLITAVAPISWGATYYVTRATLPADEPFWGAALRALPAGLVLLALAHGRLPSGDWWWRSAVLGFANVGAFFLLIYVSAQLLPSSIAASVMAATPVALALAAWLLVGERPTRGVVVGAALGIVGVPLVVAAGTEGIAPLGVLSSVTALALFSVGAVLGRRWGVGADLLATTAWQMLAGGLMLAIAAVVFSGAPPRLDAAGWAGAAFVTLVATALANLCWFAGISKLPAGAVGTIGLLNPVTGVLAGVLLAGERLGPPQALGMALVVAGILIAQRRPARGQASTSTVIEERDASLVTQPSSLAEPEDQVSPS